MLLSAFSSAVHTGLRTQSQILSSPDQAPHPGEMSAHSCKTGPGGWAATCSAPGLQPARVPACPCWWLWSQMGREGPVGTSACRVPTNLALDCQPQQRKFNMGRKTCLEGAFARHQSASASASAVLVPQACSGLSRENWSTGGKVLRTCCPLGV